MRPVRRAALRSAAVLAAFAAGLGSGPGCERSPEEEAVFAALERTLDLLGRSDWAALWSESPAKARDEVEALHRDLHEALAAVEEVYAEGEREKARAAVGRDLVLDIPKEAPDAGPRLLARLIATGALRLDDRALDGVRAGKALVDGDQAVLHTPAGEEFAFVRDGERWAPRLVLDLMERHRPISVLKENARAAIAYRDAHREAWRTSRDPKEPQGSYNLAREALEAPEGPDARALYALADDEARKAVLDALTTGREAQKVLQKKTVRKERDAVYEEHGLALHVRSESDLALFEAWVASPAFVPPLPDRSPPARLEGEADTGEVHVITEAGGRVPMVRDAGGLWHVAGLAAGLRRSLLDPTRKVLEPPPDPAPAPPSGP